jgi:hypothetical protein
VKVDIMLGLYWKEEEEKRPWKYIAYKQQAMNDAIKKGAMFFTWNKFEFEPWDGKSEPKRYGNLVLDFDCKEKPQKALDDMKNLCLVHLPEHYEVDPHSIRFFASGSKGFHSVISPFVFDAEVGHTNLPII